MGMDYRQIVGVFFWLAGVLSLVGCGDDNRRQARIPPLPEGSAQVRNQQALEALTRAISQSGAASAYARRATLYLQMSRPDQALADVNEAIESEPNIGSYHLIRAQIYRQKRDWDRALESALRAEGLGVDTPGLYLVLGDVLQEKKQYARARLYAAKVLQMSPYEGEAFYLDGLIAARLGDTAKALTNWEQSLRLKPRYVHTYVQLSAVQTALRQYEQALLSSQRGLSYFPKEAALYYQRGRTFHMVSRLDSAYRLYQQSIRFGMGAPPQFQSGLICLKWRAANRAIAHFAEVKKTAPDYPGLRLYEASAYEQLGQYDRALALLEEQLAANPGDGASRAAIWRIQRRQQYGAYGSAYDDDPGGDGLARPGTVLDTTRVRIMTIKPRSRFGSSGDSLRR